MALIHRSLTPVNPPTRALTPVNPPTRALTPVNPPTRALTPAQQQGGGDASSATLTCTPAQQQDGGDASTPTRALTRVEEQGEVSSSDDVLSGGGHNSALVGEFSNDTLTNAGYDSTFTFSSVDEGIDMSTGFSVIDDAMYMSQMGFIGGLTTETSSLESQFVNGLVDVITFPDFVST